MIDSWIVGGSPSFNRTYVVHTLSPRFIIEIVSRENEAWGVGALVWLDNPGSKDAARWSQEAGEVFERWLRADGHE